jgi:D-alanyl-D-alanine carboxypeptidase
MKKKILLFSIIAIVPFLIWGVFFYNKENVKEVVEEEPVVIDYPKLTESETLYSPEAAAVFSFYFEKDNEKVLYEKNSKDIFPIASISKLMTALVVIENYNLEEKLLVSENEVISRTEFRDFRAWSETKIEEIIIQILIESNNSGAFALALISKRFFESENDSVDLFVEMMNKKAKKIGLKNTQFINPSGLDGKDNYNSSTAEEVAFFAKYIIENNKKIFEITKMPSYRLYSPDKTVYYDVLSTNTFLTSNKKEWTSMIYGGKTGFTRAADGCLLLILEVPESEGYIVNVVLGTRDRFLEMEKLINYIYNSYTF